MSAASETRDDAIGFWRPTLLVAGREVRERARSRAFRVATALSLIGLIAAIVIPSLRGDGARTYVIALVGETPPVVPPSIAEAVQVAHARGRLVGPVDRRDVESGLRDGTYDFAVVDGRTILLHRAFASGDESRMARVVAVLSRSLGLQAALERAGLPAASATSAVRAPPAPVASLSPPRVSPTRRFAAFAGVIVLFGLIVQYAGWVLTGVVEEKESRVVEVLLCAVRPTQLLLGKVLGIGSLALAHASLLLATTLLARSFTGSSVLLQIPASALVWMAAWFLLGFALYATIYAAAGSLVSRVEDAQNASGPLMIPILLGYFTAVSVVGGGEPSLVLRALAFFPLTAPFDMPVLIAVSPVPGWQVALSVGLMVAAIAATAAVGGVVYSRSVLRSGRRVRWREALRAPAT